jgi:hypothetical protein
MKLLRRADVPPVLPGDRSYRYSAALVALVFGFGIIGAALMVVLNRPPVFGPVFGSVWLVLLLLFSRVAVARFGPDAWLVRTSMDGLYLNFRSYLAKGYPTDQPTVVFIAYNEISSAQIVKDHTRVPRLGGDTQQEVYHTYVDLRLTDDTSELKEAVDRENSQRAPLIKKWGITSRTSFDHHPVHFTGDVLRIDWGVVPSAHRFEKALGTRVRFEPLRKELHDLTNLHNEDRTKQESALIDLVTAGRTMDAIKLARKLYKYDLAQAKEFVSDLRGSKEETTFLEN